MKTPSIVRRARCLTVLGTMGFVSVGACAAIKRPPASIESVEALADSLRVLDDAIGDSVVERLARRAVARGDNTLDVLLLSGGGQMGAYGAGFLRGWHSRSSEPMPRFDLVTGVSTGALQAPFALLGTTEAMDTVAYLYRNATDQIAPTVDWFFWLRRTGGVVKVDRFERAIARAVDNRMRDGLLAAFREDRQLLIATADLDVGTGRVWDLSRELDTTAAKLARTRELFRATSAIPGIFPPVIIDGHVQSDGGTIGNVLQPLDLAACKALVERLRAHNVSAPVTMRMWVLLNVWPHAPLKVIDPASRAEIHQRGDLFMLFSQHPKMLEELDLLSRVVASEVPGLRIEMHYTALPDETSKDPAAGKLFDRGFMHRLEDLGYERARGATAWDSLPSNYQRRHATP